ncbi:hypothetical protein SB777_38175, partial [Burkholderia sp. SIMBA_052]
EYLARYGRARTHWRPPEPNDVSPEAEWGFDTALADDVAALARQMDWRVVRIDFYEPEALSFAAAAIHREWYRDAEIRP